MSSIFFTPVVSYVPQILSENYFELAQLCKLAHIPCAASGGWTKRKVEIIHGPSLRVEAEPGDWGAVRITLRKSSKEKKAQLALLILAYSLHDLVAKQSIHGATWARVPIPKGRIKTGKALSNAERQRRFRARIDSERS